MFGGINQGHLGLSIRSPKHEDGMISMIAYDFDHAIGKPLSPYVLVTEWFGCLDREHTIEQEYSLLSSTCQISIAWNWCLKFIVDFFEDIEQ
jgi:hypothetical protein